MSWDSYIDNLIGHTRDRSGTIHTDKACIIGLDGSAWTTTSHANALKLTPSEAAAIASAFKSGDFTEFMANSICVEGIKYQFLRCEDGTLVYGKKKGEGAITLQKSKATIVIGHTKEGCDQGNTNKGVEVIANYLESLGQ
ncbi:MAG: profilin [Cyanobacteria bacterium P01_G01_bin.54]